VSIILGVGQIITFVLVPASENNVFIHHNKAHCTVIIIIINIIFFGGIQNTDVLIHQDGTNMI
jgi:hypothetical protein